MSQKSAEVIVMCAFGAHTIKEVSRSQMASAVKFFLEVAERKHLKTADKSQLVKPLAMAFVKKKIVIVKEGTNMDDLSRCDIYKVGTF